MGDRKILLFSEAAGGCAVSGGAIELLRGDFRCAAEGDLAAAAAALGSGACDLVLSGCGPGAAELLRARDLHAPGVPVIIICRTIGDAAVELMSQGADYCLTEASLLRLPKVMDSALAKRAATLARAAAADRLAKAARLDALGRMARAMAHDMNNLLGAIEGYAALSLRKLSETDQLWSDLNEIRKAVQRGAALNKALLAFGRKQQAGRVPLRPEALLAPLMQKLPAGLRMEADVPGSLPEVLAAQGQLEFLLLQLISNAAEAMPAGGLVKFSAVSCELRAGEVLSPDPAAAGGRFVRFSVADSGEGMSPETVERLFEPFFTTREKGQGTGLGLAQAYGIARQHNGWLEVKTARGAGSEVSLYLPAAAAAVPGAEGGGPGQEPPAAVPPRAPRGRVLVVEDDEDLRNIAIKALSSEGYTVSAAGTIAAALALFDRPGAYAAVFSDLKLPDGNGVDLARRLLALDPGVRLIFASGALNDDDTLAFIYAGRYPFLHKPYSMDALGKLLGGGG
ncbi:MAG: response regulator [Elusimicrobiales bacterium]|nr:response regulator [Elusimicrobiales bacterium]